MSLHRWILPDLWARMRPALTDDREAQRLIDFALWTFVVLFFLLSLHSRLIAIGWL